MTGDPLDRIEAEFDMGGQLETRDVLALVEVARAARVVNGAGVGEFDTRTVAALLPLRAALARLDKEQP